VPDTKSPNLIDGVAAVRAARHSSGRKPRQARRTPAAKQKPAPRPPAKSTRATRIGHTAMPPKHDIVCYQCGYAYVLQGRVDRTYCPKCREELTMKDIPISGSWSGDIKTIGRVEIRPDAVITGGDIVAMDILIAGDVRQATIRASRRIELGQGAQFAAGTLTVKELVIVGGCRLRIARRLDCADLDIRGTLQAKIRAAGTVTIRDGGGLSGELSTAHLVIEDGAGLNAQLHVGPQYGPPPAAKSKKKAGSKPDAKKKA